MAYTVKLFELLDKCDAAGLKLSVTSEGGISVTPRELLTDELRDGLREHKADVILVIHPHLTQGGLVIPFRSPLKYRWWQGGQSVAETARELGATPEQMARYEMPKLSDLIEPIEAVRARWQALHDGTFKRAATINRKTKK